MFIIIIIIIIIIISNKHKHNNNHNNMFFYIKTHEGYYYLKDIPQSDYSKIIGARYINLSGDDQEFMYKNFYNLKFLNFCYNDANLLLSPKIAKMQQLIECSLYNKWYTYENYVIIINMPALVFNLCNNFCNNIAIIFNKIDYIRDYEISEGTLKLTLSAMSQELLDTIKLYFPISLLFLIVQIRKDYDINSFIKNNRVPYGCAMQIITY